MRWPERQAALAARLLESGTLAPAELRDDRVAAAARWSVHVNNVRSSLCRALAETFPVTRGLIGEALFRCLASRFVRAEPPARGWLSSYGATFPAFLATCESATAMPELGDLARLEWLRHESAESPGDPGLDLSRLAELTEEQLACLRLSVHPALRLLTSQADVLTIWIRETEELLPCDPAPSSPGAYCTAVSRIGPRVAVWALTPAEFIFLREVAAGRPFGAAVAASRLELGPGLVRLAGLGALGATLVGVRT